MLALAAAALTAAVLLPLCTGSMGSPSAPTCLRVWAHLAALGVSVPPLRCPGGGGGAVAESSQAVSLAAAAPPRPPPRGVIVARLLARSGNQLLQHVALRYVAARLGWALVSPPPGDLGDLGPAAGDDACPPGAELPWSWLRDAPVFSNGGAGGGDDFRRRLRRLAADPAARAFFSDFYWEHFDILAEAAAYAPRREGAPHPWLPPALRRVYTRFLAGGGGGGDSGSWPPPSHPLLRDAEGTLVLHVRLDDLARYSLQQSFMRAQGPPPLAERAAGDAQRERDEWRGRIDAPAPAHFSAALAAAAAAGSLPALAASLGLPPLLEQLEENAAMDMIPVIPLSYYRAVARGVRARQVLIVTDTGNAAHPLVVALVAEFNATVQTRGVVEDMATLMAARTLVATPSTFALMAALLGRATTVHWPHAGAGALAKSFASCLFPATADASADAGEALPPQQRQEQQQLPRFVVHDVLRAAVARISTADPAAAARMQLVHGWREDDLAACLSRHPAEPYFLSPRQLLDFYRDEGCARIFLPRTLAPDGRVHLCTDDFEEDWAALLQRAPA